MLYLFIIIVMLWFTAGYFAWSYSCSWLAMTLHCGSRALLHSIIIHLNLQSSRPLDFNLLWSALHKCTALLLLLLLLQHEEQQPCVAWWCCCYSSNNLASTEPYQREGHPSHVHVHGLALGWATTMWLNGSMVWD